MLLDLETHHVKVASSKSRKTKYILNEMFIFKRINIQRLHWLVHIVQMVENAPVLRVFNMESVGAVKKKVYRRVEISIFVVAGGV